MIYSRNKQQGFTAVELLVTLFVAAAFLIAGYQLFNVVITDGGETRAESRASNVAYDYLRRYSNSATNPCTPSSPLTSQAITIPDIADAQASIAITCPQDDAPSLSKVEAIITYGSPATSVRYATYIDKSKGASPVADVTNGLVAWWQLNNSAASSVGGANGQAIETGVEKGQDGIDAHALLFNGSSSNVLVPSENAPKPTAALTVSAWIYPHIVTRATTMTIASTTNGGGWSFYLTDSASACSTKVSFQVYAGGSYKGGCTSSSVIANKWSLVTGVYDGSTVKIYINGQQLASVAAAGTFTWPSNPVPLCIGGEPGPGAVGCSEDSKYFDGAVDDMRYYDRALSASEVLQLYNGGAK